MFTEQPPAAASDEKPTLLDMVVKLLLFFCALKDT